MKTYYSIVRFISNSISNENIALGLIMRSNGKLMYRFSEEKCNLVRKINPRAYKSINYTLHILKNSLDLSKECNDLLIQQEEIFDLEFLQRLADYEQGILQFDIPQSINKVYSFEQFEEFYTKFIAIAPNKIREILPKNTQFKSFVKSKIYAPLEGKIDVDMTIKREFIPSLYFDYRLDGLGVNGRVYSIKAIDFNSPKKPAHIQKEISEYESFNLRVDRFARSKGIEETSFHYLVTSPYSGENLSYHDLYSIISKDSDVNMYKLIDLAHVEDVVQNIIDASAEKFTSKFELI
jgi:hypothetical protein